MQTVQSEDLHCLITVFLFNFGEKIPPNTPKFEKGLILQKGVGVCIRLKLVKAF